MRAGPRRSRAWVVVIGRFVVSRHRLSSSRQARSHGRSSSTSGRATAAFRPAFAEAAGGPDDWQGSIGARPPMRLAYSEAAIPLTARLRHAALALSAEPDARLGAHFGRPSAVLSSSERTSLCSRASDESGHRGSAHRPSGTLIPPDSEEPRRRIPAFGQTRASAEIRSSDAKRDWRRQGELSGDGR
jgi:hypothetical protein